MKKTKTIDLTKLAELDIDEETSAFHPSWDNTILMTAYDERRTFVLTQDGRKLLLGRPLREVLSQFARDDDVAEYERRALYDLIGARKGRGYVAGHHRLVPTHGTTNANVVYYMAHFLDEEGITVKDGKLTISFHGRKRIFRVQIDTSRQTFDRLLKAANQVAKCQLDELDWLMHNYGVKKITKKESVRYYHTVRNHCRWTHHEARCACIVSCVHFLTEYLSTADYNEVIAKIKRSIEK